MHDLTNRKTGLTPVETFVLEIDTSVAPPTISSVGGKLPNNERRQLSKLSSPTNRRPSSAQKNSRTTSDGLLRSRITRTFLP